MLTGMLTNSIVTKSRPSHSTSAELNALVCVRVTAGVSFGWMLNPYSASPVTDIWVVSLHTHTEGNNQLLIADVGH